MSVTAEPVVVEVAPDDEAGLREWFEIEEAARAHDRPADPPESWAEHRVELTHPWPGRESSLWLAHHDGAAAGAVLVGLPTRDNQQIAIVVVTVVPSRRRRGIGTALLAQASAVARARGRRRLVLEVRRDPGGDSPGWSFVQAAGGRLALADQRRRLTVPPPDEAALTRLDAAARAAAVGYDLVGWVGATPAEHLDDIARLTARMSTDAPLGELQWEPEAYDADRIRSRDDAVTARRGVMVITAARSSTSGGLVAFTAVHIRTDVPAHAWQGDTIVDPPHRGHRLGTLVKTANLAQVRAGAPTVRMIDTWNADANPWMVSINEAMGYRPLDHWGEWEIDI